MPRKLHTRTSHLHPKRTPHSVREAEDLAGRLAPAAMPIDEPSHEPPPRTHCELCGRALVETVCGHCRGRASRCRTGGRGVIWLCPVCDAPAA